MNDTNGIPEEVTNDDSAPLFTATPFFLATLAEGQRQSDTARRAWLASMGKEMCYLENCRAVAGVHGLCVEHTPAASR